MNVFFRPESIILKKFLPVKFEEAIALMHCVEVLYKYIYIPKL